MTDWLTIRVVLSGQADEPLPRPPGRVLLAHSDHAFADLAEAIDTSFGRWDLTPLHEFKVEGRVLLSTGSPAEGDEAEDSEDVTVGEVGLRPGAKFTYVFDLGERWMHECTVEEMGVDPFELAGDEPDLPVPTYGWGMIPDQYGRLGEGDEEDEGEGRTAADADTVPDTDDDALDSGDLDDWYSAELSSWEVVEDALGGLTRSVDPEALAAAAATLRRDAGDEGALARLLTIAAGLEPEDLPDDDETLWLHAAAGVVTPSTDVPTDPDTLGAWSSLEPADWAGAVIELIRAGSGTKVSADLLLDMIRRCPEVESEELSAEDEAAILDGLGMAVGLWRTLGALDDENALTPLGAWGLPESLRLAWTGQRG